MRMGPDNLPLDQPSLDTLFERRGPTPGSRAIAILGFASLVLVLGLLGVLALVLDPSLLTITSAVAVSTTETRHSPVMAALPPATPTSTATPTPVAINLAQFYGATATPTATSTATPSDTATKPPPPTATSRPRNPVPPPTATPTVPAPTPTPAFAYSFEGAPVIDTSRACVPQFMLYGVIHDSQSYGLSGVRLRYLPKYGRNPDFPAVSRSGAEAGFYELTLGTSANEWDLFIAGANDVPLIPVLHVRIEKTAPNACWWQLNWKFNGP